MTSIVNTRTICIEQKISGSWVSGNSTSANTKWNRLIGNSLCNISSTIEAYAIGSAAKIPIMLSQILAHRSTCGNKYDEDYIIRDPIHIFSLLTDPTSF